MDFIEPLAAGAQLGDKVARGAFWPHWPISLVAWRSRWRSLGVAASREHEPFSQVVAAVERTRGEHKAVLCVMLVHKSVSLLS